MFHFVNKNDSIILHSICNGKVIPIEDVPDITFSKKLIGDGVAFLYDGDIVYSPCEGKVILVSKTNHAIGIKLKNGAEVLIHVGLDTVLLKGRGLRPLVKEKMRVKSGQAIIQIDRKLIDKNHVSLLTPVIVTNHKEFSIHKICENGDVTLGENIIEIKK